MQGLQLQEVCAGVVLDSNGNVIGVNGKFVVGVVSGFNIREFRDLKIEVIGYGIFVPELEAECGIGGGVVC
jgi:hypothetical protein